MIDGQEWITLEGAERLTPGAVVEVQDHYARYFLMLRTPVPRNDGSRWGHADRRQCVRQAMKTPEPEPQRWPHTWHRNDPEARYRRLGGWA